MTVEIRLLGPSDRGVLERVAPGVFDHPVEPRWTERDNVAARALYERAGGTPEPSLLYEFPLAPVRAE